MHFHFAVAATKAQKSVKHSLFKQLPGEELDLCFEATAYAACLVIQYVLDRV
jgi:hypothetical protein